MTEPAEGLMVTSNVRLLRPLGEGGMGAVWIAEHQSLRTNVVVKFMARELAQSPEAKARFSREAAAASQVKSPHVVQMLDHGVLESGNPYIVMELLEGRDLEQQILDGGRLEPREVVAIVAQLARALSKAHERGIVHRDIKPSNVFLCDAGGGELFVKLLDFGIAKSGSSGAAAIIGSTTRTGSFIGSPFYMSPEQVIGAKDIDFRTDLWSLGVVAFEALTGDKPFFAETVGALALKIHRDAIPTPTSKNHSLPAAVDAWFVRACAREPVERYASARDMADALAVAVLGEGGAAAVRVESVPSPRKPPGLATTQSAGDVSPSASTRSGADARSETGAGVGLVSRHRLPINSRGRWLVVGAIAAVAILVGFAVPRLMGSRSDPGVTSAAALSSGLTPAAPKSVAPAPSPVDFTLAAATSAASDASASSPAPAPSGAVVLAPAPAPAPTLAHAPGFPSPSHTAHAKPSSSASAPPPSSAAPAPSTTKPPRGSDDDIK